MTKLTFGKFSKEIFENGTLVLARTRHPHAGGKFVTTNDGALATERSWVP